MPLRQKIEHEIRDRGPIPFSRYMELCLYDPELGYYSRNAEQFGKAGDFYTSSDVHAVFGRLLARQFDEMWRALGSPANLAVQRTRPRPRPLRARCTGLVGKEVPGFLSRPALRTRRTLARAARANQANSGSPSRVGKGRARASLGRADIGQAPAAERRKSAAHGASRGSDGTIDEAPKGRKSLIPETPHNRLRQRILRRPAGRDPKRSKVPCASTPATAASSKPGLQPSPEELEFLDRYSVHPEEGERVEVPLDCATHYGSISPQP